MGWRETFERYRKPEKKEREEKAVPASAPVPLISLFLDQETPPVTPSAKELWCDLQEDFQERAAIMEFDAKLPRHEAELAAWTCVVNSLRHLRH